MAEELVRKEVARPINLTSPSGNTARPQIREVIVNGEKREEAHYYDPVTGQFFRKETIAVWVPKNKA